MSDIAINPVTRRVQFTGNTGTGPYAFTFNILVDGDIAVFKGTTELTLTTDYTVSINANGTGSITLTAALIASDVLTIIGGRELSRTTDFVTAGDLLASSLNEQLDSNVIMTQQLDEKLGRGLFVNPGDVFTNLELPLKDDRKGTVLGFNETTGDPEPGPTLSDVDSLATISADIKTLAEIQDGTVATDAITNVNTIRTDVSTVSGISSNVTTVAGNTSNINTVAGNNANITTVAGINSDVTTVSGISSDVTTVAADGADIGVVAGLSSDIITVSGVSTEIGRLGTADAVSDMNALSPAAVIADMDSLADNVSAISIVSDDIGNVIAVAVNAANINTVAADGADIGTVAGDISNVNTVATNITSVNTNATNITDIQNASANAATATTQAGIATTQAGIATTKASEASASEVAAEAAKVAAEAALDEFTDIYLGAKASDPTTDNDGNALTAGDQYFNTTINVLKIYNGSAWQAAAIDSSGFVETTGDTMTGNLSFGDNDKAIFGAGSDLQIYHDGSHSYVQDAGSGNLYLRQNGTAVIIDDGTNNLAAFNSASGESALYYGGSGKKLATTSTGIDVTGTVTADGLTVDGDGLFNGGFNDPKTITLNSLRSVQDNVLGKILFQNTSNDVAEIYANSGPDGTNRDEGKLVFRTAEAGGTMRSRILVDHEGDISFYDSAGSSQSFFWDAAAERLGLGTTSPSASLHIENTSSTHMYLKGSSGDPYGLWVNPTGTTFILGSWGNGARINLSDSSEYISFGTGSSSTERMRIDSSGRVGIGTSSPLSTLVVSGGGDENIEFIGGSPTTNGGVLQYIHRNDTATRPDMNYYLAGGGGAHKFWTNNTERMRIDSSGNVGIGTSDANPYSLASTGTTLALDSTSASVGSLVSLETAGVKRGYLFGNDSNIVLSAVDAAIPLMFKTNDTERMRIDSSGNLLVGKTSLTLNTEGHALAPTYARFTRNGGAPVQFNRTTSDGDIAIFYKDGSTVGSIGTNGGDVYIGTGDTGVRFVDSLDCLLPLNTSTNATRDAAIDIGYNDGGRFKDLYLSGGVVFGDAGGSGTSTSNTLDSYEEGTFTPTAFGASTAGTTTYASQIGSYTKVGDMVSVDIYISWSAMTGTGNLEIGGLPFTSSSASSYFATGTIVPLLGFTWPSGTTQLNPLIGASATEIAIYGSATDSNSVRAATDSEIVALAITITYKV